MTARRARFYPPLTSPTAPSRVAASSTPIAATEKVLKIVSTPDQADRFNVDRDLTSKED